MARTTREIIAGGALAGVVAGLTMGLVAMGHAAAMGMEVWLLLDQIAALILGVRALLGGPATTLLGLAIHLAVSAALGVLFAMAVPRWTSTLLAFASGLVYGVLVWAILTWIVLPLFNPVMAERMQLWPGAWFVHHLVFGGVLAVTPALERAAGPSHPEGEAPLPT
jgi:uncharacterized membrane protein YagU involved in acid resistance